MKVKHILRECLSIQLQIPIVQVQISIGLLGMLGLYISLGNLLHKKPITEQIQYLDGIKALSILFAAMPLELYALYIGWF